MGKRNAHFTHLTFRLKVAGAHEIIRGRLAEKINVMRIAILTTVLIYLIALFAAAAAVTYPQSLLSGLWDDRKALPPPLHFLFSRTRIALHLVRTVILFHLLHPQRLILPRLNLLQNPRRRLLLLSISLLDLVALVVVVLEEAQDGAYAGGTETVGWVADCEFVSINKFRE